MDNIMLMSNDSYKLYRFDFDYLGIRRIIAL